MTIGELGQLVRAWHRDEAAIATIASRLDWLLRRLAEFAGVAGVSIRAAEIASGSSEPGEDRPVLAFDSEGVAPTPTSPVGSLAFFGKTAVLGDMRDAVTSVFEGPAVDLDANLTADRDCIFVRIRLPHLLVWVLLYVRKAARRSGDTADWTDALRTMLTLTAPNPLGTAALRRRFFQELVSYAPISPAVDYRHICEAWLRVSGADWCWLWMLNEVDPQRTYELTSACARSGLPPLLPPRREAPGRGALGHFACRAHRPVFIENLSGWRAERDDESYRVVMSEFFERAGTRGLLCVPLFEPQQTSAMRAEEALTNVVSLQYRDPASRVVHDDEVMLVMGRLTARLITQSEEHEQHDILVRLNRIAQGYLAQLAIRPSDSRPKYLDDLIGLIKARLNVEYVSIFYRTPFENAVECIGTTGLWETATGKPVPRSALSIAKYAAGERNTGVCFAESRPIVATADEDTYDYKFTERRGSRAPSLYVPIPDPLAQHGSPALGVIRCYARRSPVFNNEHANFNRAEVDSLSFLAEQVGPILQTFEHRILRERTVSVVKHDLSSPLAMMRDVVWQLIDDQEHGRAINPIHLHDLRSTIKLASNLVVQLDPDPGAVGPYHPRPTLLEGDIVARLVDMLRGSAEDAGMRIRFDGFRQVPALFVDAALIERAVYNVMLNAIKYGDSNTEILINAAALPDGGGYTVDVLNEGIGVEAADERLIFAAGYRSTAATARAVGAGLGLPIAKRAMERHGGDLLLRRRKNPTIFRLFFPAKLARS